MRISLRRTSLLLILALCARFVIPVSAQSDFDGSAAAGDEANASDTLDAWSPVSDLVNQTGAKLRWDPLRQVGTLRQGATYLRFTAGFSWAILNHQTTLTIEPPRVVGGEVFFSPTTYQQFASVLQPSRADGPRVAAIVIDPGHGGRDPGAIATHRDAGSSVQVNEKDVVLDVGRMLYTLLSRSMPDRTVVMTRDDDRFLSLEQRTNLANDIEVSPEETIIFISIHANASLRSSPTGFEVWYLPPNVERDDLVDPEELEVDNPSLLPILNRLRGEEYTIGSMMLAQQVLQGMDEQIGEVSPNRGLREESWYVVRMTKMPSVLVELGFVTNPVEGTRLLDPAYLQQLAQGIYNGVTRFISRFEHL